MLATMGLARPVSSGFLSGETTSTKLGDDRRYPRPEALAASNCSPGLRSAIFISPPSVSRLIFHWLVALVEVTETDLIFSTLKKSLLSHCSGHLRQGGGILRGLIALNDAQGFLRFVALHFGFRLFNLHLRHVVHREVAHDFLAEAPAR